MRLHHLALRTADVPRLERFYVEVLGLAVVARRGPNVWLDADGTIVMLEPRGEGEVPIDPRSMELTCFAVRADAGATLVARVAGASIAIEGRTAFSVYFRDPDGRRVGISSYPDPLAIT
jgi:catechol 2,3-dioxygenase-like lactoylglutathione lyase family enzyme